MGPDPHWQVDVEIFGDEVGTYARASLIAHHRLVMGFGAAPSCAGRQCVTGMGDDAAVAAALEDLAHKLTAEHASHATAHRPDVG